jgi:prepilin-type N-terminal cleavage/methylation domain-containing protein
MTSLPIAKRRTRQAGFTLVELLTVIAVIAILAAILIPVSGMVRRKAYASQTKSQFAQYATAYLAFKADYGFLPSMGESDAEFGLQGNNEVFIETLTGRTVNGAALNSSSYAGKANRRGTRYYTFSTTEFASTGDPYAGEIVDGYGNPNIFAVIDKDRDGFLDPSDFSALPSNLRPANRIPGQVVFYSSNAENNPDWEWVLSWE